MKKIFALLAMASMFAFASCGPDNPDNPENPDSGKDIPALTLSAANIDVAGIDGDFMAVVDNSAKTIKINLEYVDKENAKALTVNFKSLPEGFTTEYQKTFNYSDGATQTVTFKYGDKTAAEYVISVVLGAPEPKCTSLTVGEIDALGGEVRMASAASLTHLPVEFTVEPATTVVTVNGEAIESGAELDFSDKINGVTFTLTLGEATKTHKVVVITSGIRKANRVWGHYANPQTIDDDWFQTQAIDLPVSDHWIRTLGIDNNYMYLAQHKGSPYGAYVVSLTDGSIVGRLALGAVEGGTHALSCIRTIPDGDGGYKILQCNLVAGEGTLKVYKWDDKDSTPSVLLSYVNVDKLRLGDKMGVWGTWKDGTISFLAQSGNPRKLYMFKLTDGVLNQTPTVVELGDFGKSTYGQAYLYSDSEMIINATGIVPMSFSVSGTTFTKTFDGDSNVFGQTEQGFNFFEFNDQKYMCFAHLEQGLADGSLRIMALNGETLAEALAAVDPLHVFRYGIGDPNECPITGNSVGNSLADCTVRVIGGDTYIGVVVADCGVSLFKLEE